MQKTGMDRIENRVQHLQPVALVVGSIWHQRLTFDFERIVNRKLGHIFDRPQVGKYQSAVFLYRVGTERGLVLDQVGNLLRLAGYLENAAIDIE